MSNDITAITDAGFDQLAAMEGERISACRGVELRRLRWAGATYVVKLSLHEKLGKVVERLFRGGGWCSRVATEAVTLQRLAVLGFKTVTVVSYGTDYRLGVPVRGFMLTGYVAGDGLDILFKRGAANDTAWYEYGRLSSDLLAAGCWEPLRAKDILVSGGEFHLLDRTQPLILQAVTRLRVRSVLTRMIYRNRRDGVEIGGAGWEGFCRGLAGGKAGVPAEWLAGIAGD